jgi:hypothetical protein
VINKSPPFQSPFNKTVNTYTLPDLDAFMDGLHQLTNAQLQALYSLIQENPVAVKALIKTEVLTRGRREKFDRENGYPARGLEAKS